MTAESSTTWTRRAVVSGALGAGAATLATAIGRPLPTWATTGDPVVAGGSYSATQSTNFTITGGTFTPALTGTSAAGNGLEGSSTSFYGVYGVSVSNLGVLGHSNSNTGVRGTSSTGTGVHGSSGSAWGVAGNTNAAGYAAVLGSSDGAGTGVHGYSGSIGTEPPAMPKTGVYGVANQDATSRGVVGTSAAGAGVHGFVGAGTAPAPASRTGVYGRCDIDAASRGVSGYSATGAGVYGGTDAGKAVSGVASGATGTALAGTASNSAGYALRTSGRIVFAKVSGIATIAANASTSVAIASGTDITTASYVLLTPQSDPGTRRFWATLDTAANTITIHSNTVSASAIKIAWLLVG